MAKDTKAEEPVAEPQGSPMPSEDEKKAEDLEETSGESQEEETQEPEGLPEDAKERTKREFDKLQSQLRDERTRREYYEALINSNQQPQQEQSQFVDPYTGQPDEKLNALAKSVSEMAQTIEQERQERVKANQREEEEAVYAEYPELNPEGKSYDKTFRNLTRSIALGAMVDPDAYGGKELTFMEAAKEAKKIMKGNVEEAKKEGATEAVEQLTPKEQASLEAVGSPSRRSEVDDLAELRQASRGKDSNAVQARIERFKRIQGQE